jgi:tetratricopeptide (TPR) repeat protein/V8-like Glu-specific endopeptidase
MKYPLILGCTAALVSVANPAIAKSPSEIKAIAQSVTVEIKTGERVGSGSIVHRQGNLYTLITNRHVACGSKTCKLPATETYNLSTSDGQQYRVSVAGVKLLGEDLDLAIIQFRSSRNYLVAQLAEPDQLKANDAVYTAGFPKGQGFLFGEGKAQAVVNKRLTGDGGGYTVIYNAKTLPGMSGGGAFDKDGRLVAVHGVGDRYKENTQIEDTSSVDNRTAKAELGRKIGLNRGIPIRWILQGLRAQGIMVGNSRTPSKIRSTSSTADEYFIAGFNKVLEPGDDLRAGKQESIHQLSRAIRINPRYASAYLMRGIIYEQLQVYAQALADYDKAIALDPKLAVAYYNRAGLKSDKLDDPQGALADYNKSISINPKNAGAYANRGLLKKNRLYDSPGALTDYDKAISIDSQDDNIYNLRGVLKAKLKDSPGALADYNKAISVNPKNASVYNNRGSLKQFKLNDFQGALADYNAAISINPKFALAYFNRGNLKRDKLKDPQGALADHNKAVQYALADYNQSISINPKNAIAYSNRGDLKANRLNDPNGALSDYNKAISINPKFADVYVSRGVLKISKFNDRPGAIKDFQAAAKIYRQQGQTTSLKVTVYRLRALGATE